MDEKLVRMELPIQSVYQRGENVTVTVPIHLEVMDLPERIRTDVSLIKNAKDAVKLEYDEDMVYYLGILRNSDIELPWLESYEKFRDEWQLSGEPDKNGFLSLLWRVDGEIHDIKFNPVPMVLHNQHDEFREFYTPESFMEGGSLIEIIYRNITDPEVIIMSPDKLRKYGRETSIARIDEEKGIAEVVGSAFTSDYHKNMAKTLLLRDFAIFYLNRLLDKVNRSSH